MMRIRKEQIEALSQYMLRGFEAKAAAHLRQRYPAKVRTFSDSDLRALIRERTRAASRYEIRAQKDILEFLELAVVLGRDFDTRSDTSWARGILERRDLWPWEKLQQIEDHVTIVLKGKV